MSMYRKLTAILLALSVSTACLTACSDQSEETTTRSGDPIKEIVSLSLDDDPPAKTSDTSSSDLSDPDARFHEVSDRVIEAGKSVLGLQEADEKQKQDILTKFSASTELYERGAYYTITPEDLDILNCDFNLVPLNRYNVRNLTILSRYVSIEADFRAAIIEAVDESEAKALFSEILGLYSIFDESKMEQDAKDLNYRYYYDYSDDSRFVLIIQSDHSVPPFVYYFIREGDLITLVVYSDELGNTFFDECNDFMVAAGLEDMRALLDSAQPATPPTDTSATDTSKTTTPRGPHPAGRDFEEVSASVVNSAKTICDAQEIDEEHKDIFLKDFENTNEYLMRGYYLEFSPDDIQNFEFTLGGIRLAPNDISNVTMFAKNNNKEDMFDVIVIEAANEGIAAEYYNRIYKSVVFFTEDDIKSFSEYYNVKYNTYEDNDKYMFAIALRQDPIGNTMYNYILVEGDVLTIIMFSGALDTVLLEDFYAFMVDAGFDDMEAFLLEGEEIPYGS